MNAARPRASRWGNRARMEQMGPVDPTRVLTKVEPLTSAVEAYKHFDKRERGWITTELSLPTAAE